MTTPYQKYQQSSVQTASPGKLTIMLYDGAIRFVKQGIDAIEASNIERANHSLIKAQNIIHELIASLDFQYPLANNLHQIYEYMLHQLITANVRKSKVPAAEVLQHLTDLREAWMMADNPALQARKVEHG